MEDKDGRCCGNCCWFYGENTDGDVFCALSPLDDSWVRCYLCCKTEFVSRKEMRHHMAVLLQYHRSFHNPWNRKVPDKKDLIRASAFAYEYMKVFSKL